MSKINQPYDFLEDTQFLKQILHEDIALQHNDRRPLEELDRLMRQFARDFLRNYLKDSFKERYSADDIEKLIADFEQETYGTQNKTDDQGKA